MAHPARPARRVTLAATANLERPATTARLEKPPSLNKSPTGASTVSLDRRDRPAIRVALETLARLEIPVHLDKAVARDHPDRLDLPDRLAIPVDLATLDHPVDLEYSTKCPALMAHPDQPARLDNLVAMDNLAMQVTSWKRKFLIRIFV